MAIIVKEVESIERGTFQADYPYHTYFHLFMGGYSSKRVEEIIKRRSQRKIPNERLLSFYCYTVSEREVMDTIDNAKFLYRTDPNNLSLQEMEHLNMCTYYVYDHTGERETKENISA